ncbi:MAG: thiamine pyrophosphate-dependent dehydrogenase E1 component subunit alpha [Anaerolineae bacterium]|jgi:TPP-dependent pyruvate/acetoin dehydrogenase alpha subunit
MSLKRDTAITVYRNMLRIREFEETMVDVYNAGFIPGFVHPGIGEEAVHAGVCAVLRPDDVITATHRGHGQCLAKGTPPDLMMAELMGKVTGTNKGRGGSMHITHIDAGVMPVSGIVAGGIPMASGAALAFTLEGSDRVAVSFFGDGAANRGAFHEAVNLSAVWRLPVVYVCIDNNWAISVPREVSIVPNDIVARAPGYGIHGLSVDGHDAGAVYRAAADAVQRARGGEGPTLLVCKAPRWIGHEEGDPQVYRSKEDIERARKLDPIPRFKSKLLELGYLSEADDERMRAEATAEIEQAVEFAKTSPLPEAQTALDYIYGES